MLPDRVSRRLVALEEVSKQGKRVKDLFRLMENPALWKLAYSNLYANKGATTPGVESTTMDGFSDERAHNLIGLLKKALYQPKPVRRTYIPKKNGKKRPLGIPSGDDKLVQEVARMLLAGIYEPIFSDRSHGFRPRHSCHTALEQIRRNWAGVKWIVIVDIQGFYDNINHHKLVELLEQKIDDKRYINLIKLMLKAGYMEDWQFHATYSGTPQGGIISPILANVVLHELDIFMDSMKKDFDRGQKRSYNRVYHNLNGSIYKLRKRIDGMKEDENASECVLSLKQRIKKLDQQRKQLPSVEPFDPGYRRLLYCRYADDSAPRRREGVLMT